MFAAHCADTSHGLAVPCPIVSKILECGFQSGFTLEYIVYHSPTMLHNIFTFSVRDQKILVHHFDQIESRGDLTLAMLQAVLGECGTSLEGKTGWVSYMDFPPEPHVLNKADLKFCTTRILGEDSPYLPFPCPHTVAWPQIGLSDADGLMRDLLAWNENFTSDRIFWIGANTHFSRAALATLAAAHPEAIDAEIMSWNRSDP
jgi:hypothetical protein